MKLKYYMRGLGIGIILTTLILRIGVTKENLSDKEIISRAKTLGMEMKEENNSDLDKVLDNMNLTGTPAPEPSVTSAAKPTPEPTAGPTAMPTAFPTFKPLSQPTKVPEKVSASTKTETNDQGDNQGISFTIEQGMSSGKVAKLLVQKGLVVNADDFNQYMMSIGKAGVIRVGDYSLPEGASFQDIVNTITSK